MKKVSVIIPTYNREKTIGRAVKSVLSQTYENIEVIVVDDGSTDSTRERLEQFKDERLRYVCLEANGGVSNARNVGVKLAQGEWVAFQDSDDSWRKEKLEKQMSYAGEHSEYSLIYGFYQANLKDGNSMQVPARFIPDEMEGWIQNTLLQRNVIGAPTMLVKRENFLECGGFDITYKSLEDWEFALRFSEKYQIGCVPEVLMDVYMLEGGVSSKVGPYYESRCRMLATYRKQMLQAGVFEIVVLDILNRAQSSGILEPVKRMIEIYMK